MPRGETDPAATRRSHAKLFSSIKKTLPYLIVFSIASVLYSVRVSISYFAPYTFSETSERNVFEGFLSRCLRVAAVRSNPLREPSLKHRGSKYSGVGNKEKGSSHLSGGFRRGEHILLPRYMRYNFPKHHSEVFWNYNLS